MILITILVLTLLLLIIFCVGAVSVLGAGVVILFGDVIVCGLFIAWLIKRLIKKKKD